MPTIDELRRRVWDLYAEPTPKQRTTFLENLEAAPMLESAGGPVAIRQFSVFNHLHAERAAMVYDEFFALAEQSEFIEEGVEAVLRRYEELKGSENPELLYHALSVFITHHRYGKVLTIPDIVVREPELAMPSKGTSSTQMPGLENFNDTMGGASGDEGKLDWFREDPQQNEHHAHWHNVYPTGGVPIPGTNRRKYKDRQGEMFLYMHQQMLARYEVERIALGIAPLKAYTFSGPISSGYNPGNFITAETGRAKRDENTEVSIRVFSRQNGQSFTYTPAQHREQKQRLDNALKSRTLRGNGPDTDENKIRVADRLGHTLEPSGPPNERIPGFGNYHGMGHVLISKSHLEGEVDLDNSSDGVMAVPNTAIRDSIFYRWHKHIDDYSFAVQEQFRPREYGDAPSVFFDHRTTDEEGEPFSADIILCLNRDIPGMHPDFDGKTFGKLAFGGDNWDRDFSSGEFTAKDGSGREISFRTTDTLITSMNKGEIKFKNSDGGETHEYDYLNHEPFCYFIRIRNNGAARTITFRIFLVPEGADPATGRPYQENRRLWIEMDKVLADLERNSNNVFFQFDRKSSVVRKPAEDPAKMNLEYTPSILDGGILETLDEVYEWEMKLRAYYRRQVKTPNLQADEQNLLKLRKALQANQSQQRQDAYINALLRYRSRITEEVAYCDCGWPYNLLVPRGTQEGMRFKLMVMATDAAFDVDEIGCCGSMSYCGAKDSYPDKRPMGYPFDRPFPKEGIVNTLNALSNVAFRSIRIQCANLDEFES